MKGGLLWKFCILEGEEDVRTPERNLGTRGRVPSYGLNAESTCFYAWRTSLKNRRRHLHKKSNREKSVSMRSSTTAAPATHREHSALMVQPCGII